MAEEKITTLEEAAEEYEKNHTHQQYDGGGFTPEYNATLAEAFLAGAQCGAEHQVIDGNKMIELSKGLEETAYTYSFESRPSVYGQVDVIDAFIAGANWQKEQDQPITGNSLEQEWLRYVDKKKKENRGELPALGEYGWLKIARHFANWQAAQMPMPEDTVLFQKGVEEGKRLMMEDAVECELYRDGDFFASIDIDIATLGYTEKDKVKIIIVKEEDEK